MSHFVPTFALIVQVLVGVQIERCLFDSLSILLILNIRQEFFDRFLQEVNSLEDDIGNFGFTAKRVKCGTQKPAKKPKKEDFTPHKPALLLTELIKTASLF